MIEIEKNPIKNYRKLKCEECINGNMLEFQFSMAFQPIVDTRTKTVFSQEALVRGVNNEPANFILSKINDENRYSFDQSCRVKAIELASRLGLKSKVNINFFPNAIYQPETCIQTTLEASQKYGLPISSIILEITEGEQVVNHSHIVSIFKEYRKQGLLTAIDDFGAGYSGLNLLADFQPDFLKLDMLLIRNIDKDKTRRIIVNSIVKICQEINISVIAEGVETKSELDCLEDLGIFLFQGYYYSKPSFEALTTPKDFQ